MSSREIVYAAAGVSTGPATFVEDVFSTWLYTGNGSSQTITNNIDLSTKGGMVWTKARNLDESHNLFDTVRGVRTGIQSNSTAAQYQADPGFWLTAFNSNGFTMGLGDGNANGYNYASWTFREQPKFMDVITWTGNGVGGREISHSLGSTPGMIIAKRTDTTGVWYVYHRSLGGASNFLSLNTTNAVSSGTNIWFNTDPTSTAFTVGTVLNTTGGTYVAYIFAHDAGGFGTTGADNVISCGSFVSGAGGTCPPVNLGYEPQYVLYKNITSAEVWRLADVMRGFSQTQSVFLNPNLSGPEGALDNNPSYFTPTATGFQSLQPGLFTAGDTFIYMAIRRPMKVPTTGTSVFSPVSQAGGGTVTTGFPTDLVLAAARTIGTGFQDQDRLRGFARELYPSSTSAEANNGSSGYNLNLSNTSFLDNQSSSSYTWIYECFRRATGFMDAVCWAGTGGMVTLNHNLGVSPELIIVKARGTNSFGPSNNWFVYCSYLSGTPTNQYLNLNTTGAVASNTNVFSNAAPTSTTFGTGGLAQMDSGVRAVAYLFATCAGVSKVGSYTGNGGTQAIACGFTGGARFVLIKRTDSTGNWWVWDTARGMVTSTDPRLALNTTAAEVNNDWVFTTTGGFQIVTSDATINASGGSYIFLAIA